MRQTVVEQGKRVPSGAGVCVVDMFGRNRDKLAFICCGPGGFGKPGDQAGPEDVGFSLHHAVDLVADSIVVAYRYLAGIVLVGFDGGETVVASGFGTAGFLDKGAEHGLLVVVDVPQSMLQSIIQVIQVEGYR